jgi:hypothetical protein
MMNTLHLIREIYIEAFRNISSFILKKYLKVFTWFAFAMYGVVLYAFVFRIATGFAFD